MFFYLRGTIDSGKPVCVLLPSSMDIAEEVAEGSEGSPLVVFLACELALLTNSEALLRV